jgi:hypothetical protein
MPQLISRQVARQGTLVHYFTGNPCKRGHVAERYSRNGECVICAKLRAAGWKKTHKGRGYQRDYDRAWHAKQRSRSS